MRWRARDVVSLRKAVGAYNRAVTMMGRKYGEGVELPPRVTVDEVRRSIATRADYDEWKRTLGNVLKKNKPHAQDLAVLPDGTPTVRYVNDENKRLARRVQAKSRAAIAEFYPGFELFTKEKQATILSDSKIDLTGRPRVGAAGLAESRKAATSKLIGNVEKYIEFWEKGNGDPSVPARLRDLMQSNPAELDTLFQTRYDQFTVDYVYYGDKKDLKEPKVDRHSKVVEFWDEWYPAIKNGSFQAKLEASPKPVRRKGRK